MRREGRLCGDIGERGPFFEWLASPAPPPVVLPVEVLLPPALADLAERCSTLQDLERQEDAERAFAVFLAFVAMPWAPTTSTA